MAAVLPVAAAADEPLVLKPEDAAILPLAAMPIELRQRVTFVVVKRTLRRVMTSEPFASSLEGYTFLLDHLPLAARLAAALAIDRYRIEATAPGQFFGDDQSGLTGNFTVAYQATGRRIYYGEGVYVGALLPRMSGRTVMVLEFHPIERQGRPFVETRLTVYLRLEQRPLRYLLKPLLPLVSGLVNRKLSRFLTAARRLSEALAAEPRQTWREVQQSQTLSEADKRCVRQLLSRLPGAGDLAAAAEEVDSPSDEAPYPEAAGNSAAAADACAASP